MTVNYTTNLALGQPVTGTESGTWGDDVNNSVTSYLDIAIAGGLAITITTTDVTLTNTQGTSVATNIGSTTAQYAILNVSGAMTAARNLILPSSSRQYVINNNTTGGFALTVKGTATTGVTLVNGEKAHVFWNGSDYAKLSNTPGGAGTFSSITNTGLTSGRVVYSTTGGLETDSANLTFNGTTLTANTIGAFTLSGTIAGGGNQINNVIIGTTTPLAGAFTTLSASGTANVGGGTAYATGVTIKPATDDYQLTLLQSNSNAAGWGLKADTAGAVKLTRYGTSAYGSVGLTLAVNGAATLSSDLTVTGTLSGGTSGTGYSFSGSAAAGSLALDSSGNLGLGVTPSAWSLLKGLQTVGGGFFGSNSNSTFVGANWYYDGANKYIANGYASRYITESGTHAWYNAPSGTAGNAITFTQAMTLDASGNLEIGGTFAQGRKLAVDSSTNGYTMQLLQTSAFGSGNLAGTVYSGYYDGSSITDMASIRGGKENATSGNYAGMLAFYTRPNGGSDTERARIDSSGNLLVGCTSLGAAGGFGVGPNSGSSFIDICHITGTTSGTAYARLFFNSSQIGSITQSGTTAVLYNTTSDQRLKENITDADSASTLIDALQVRKFDWKADGSHQRYGFVAQELVTVAPEAVHQPEDSEEMMAVDYSKLVPMLVKEVQSLRARVAQLESKP